MIRFRKTAGTTLIELVVGVAVSAFLFGILGSMVYVSARSAFNIHEQMISQTAAGKASERAAALLRNAVGYRLVSGDAADTPITRLYVEIPASPTATMTHTLCLRNVAGGKRELCYYESQITSWAADGTASTSVQPAFRSRVANFSMIYDTEYRVVLHVGFAYRGFALVFNNPGLPQYGDFISEAIAKNHFMDQGVDNYAQADDPTLTPATL